VQLPVQQVDVIISEWMGYFLLLEGVLDSVIAARDKYLAPNGTMVPSTGAMYMTAISDDQDCKATVGMWHKPYGLKFDYLLQHTLRYPSVHAVDPATVITATMLLSCINLNTCSVKDLDFTSKNVFKSQKSCKITALVGFFDIGYHLPSGEHKIMISTSPTDTITHWGHTVFYLETPFPVKEGEPVTLTADVRKAPQDKRGLSISLKMSTVSSGTEWHQDYEMQSVFGPHWAPWRESTPGRTG